MSVGVARNVLARNKRNSRGPQLCCGLVGLLVKIALIFDHINMDRGKGTPIQQVASSS